MKVVDEMPEYDSRPDTWEHIQRVREYLNRIVLRLLNRAQDHDASKLVDPEKAMFDKFTPKLATMHYGSDEYKQTIKEMGPGLRHHYKVNSHHPEHYPDGIQGMSLIDLVEMFCDWWAATERSPKGNIRASIAQNQSRFDYSDDLMMIMLNTVDELERLR